MVDIKKRISKHRILIVVPTYNNAATIEQVITDIKEYSDDVLVVNDGSTDTTQDIINSLCVEQVSYSPNKGKGNAIQQALKYAKAKAYKFILTIDSDGQHYASDIVQFVEFIEQRENKQDILVIGSRNLTAENMPSKNTFANKFSNFWFYVETGNKLSDTQSGFRLYPVDRLAAVNYFSMRYEFEVEVIVRAAWKGINVCNVPIKVYYPPQEERVSHFKPLKDFSRISILNTFLVIIALLYYYPWKFLRMLTKENIQTFIKHNITESPESNARISSAIALGILLGIVPLWGYQMILAAIVAHILKVNKLITLISSNISVPPMIPFILYGSFWTGGLILGRDGVLNFDDISFDKVYGDLLQYITGAMVFAVACATLAFIISIIILKVFRKKKD